MGTKTKISVALVVFGVCLQQAIKNFDPMKGLSNDVALSPWMVQTAVTLFCLNPLAVNQFLKEGRKGDDHWDPTNPDGEVVEDFLVTGEVREDEYEKASIYAILYGLYRGVGKVKHTNGKMYEFSFNTWGIHNVDDVPYGPDEPERHGKAAYNKLASSFPKVQELMANRPNNSVQFLEIGCGTGAGANLISSEVWPNIGTYNALDMQAGAIRKCNSWGNPKMNCVHGNGKVLPFEDNSMDVIVVSETHIAEMEIGDEEKAIFGEMIRVLKKGGIFVWGNALPTKVWFDGEDYLTSVGFKQCGAFNHTESAVIARDQDQARVALYLEQLFANYPVFQVPYLGPKCLSVSDMLIKNFFRDVGTDLYLRMVTRHDSYMHMCYELNSK